MSRWIWIKTFWFSIITLQLTTLHGMVHHLRLAELLRALRLPLFLVKRRACVRACLRAVRILTMECREERERESRESGPYCLQPERERERERERWRRDIGR